MIIVSNTSPLTNLAAIGQFDLLQNLYTKVHITQGVWDELNAYGQHWPGRNEVIKATNWITRFTVQNAHLVTTLRQDLDRGEAESIALALELNADFILLDEKEGRRIAKRLGLKRIGVAGILLEAKAKGFIKKVQPHLTALRHAGFYLSEALYQSILTCANENNTQENS